MNDKELRNKVHSAMYSLIKEKGSASPAEVLMAADILSKADYESWRGGRIDYLERACKTTLRKLSLVNREIRAFAEKNGLKPSYTACVRHVRVKSIRLRFSKSGDENIERQYATHYLGSGNPGKPEKTAESPKE